MGFLEFVDNKDAFLGLSYALRFVNKIQVKLPLWIKYICNILGGIYFRFIAGVADAAAWSSLITILMVIFPNKTSLIVGTTEMVFGVGLALG